MKAKELFNSLQKVGRKEIKKPSLEPQLCELRHAIENDPIFKRIATDKSVPLNVFAFTMGESIEQLTTTTHLFDELISSQYKKTCERELIRLCSNNGSKIDIILISKLYISDVINRGYSKEFIYKRANETFYKEDIARCTKGILERFFNFFPDKPTPFDVLFSCSLGYADFMARQFGAEVHESVTHMEPELRGQIPESFGQGEKKRIIPVRKVQRMDAYSAARTAETLFSLSRSFLYLHPENVNAQIDATVFVVNQKSKEITSVALDKGFSPRRSARTKRENAKSITGLASYVFSTSSPTPRVDDGKHRVLSSLNSASLAAKTSDPESRLLSIWSAFEALLPDPMKDGEGIVRIVHFSSLISPCAVFDYLPVTFSECFRNCATAFGEPFLDVVSSLGKGETEIEKFTSLFIADQEAKQSLCRTVSSSPLMLMRFHRLEKLLTNPKNACGYLETHERRVGWQIHRIYRERNGIVHKAAVSPFLGGLIENAYSYYRSVILSLERVHSKYQISHPDQGLEMARVLYAEYKQGLQRISDRSGLPTSDRNTQFVQSMFSDCLLS